MYILCISVFNFGLKRFETDFRLYGQQEHEKFPAYIEKVMQDRIQVAK
jgi:hypothetical protein